MATLISFNPNRAVDLNSFAIPGALALFYDSGTSRPRIVYSDPECTLPHPSPLAADGAGVFPAIYDTGDGDVKVEVTTPEGVMLAGYPMDPARAVSTGFTGASAIQFSPTEDIPETNVQGAIERVQDNLIQPLLDYGLGVTGNAPLLSDIDAVNIASGIYRFTGDTAGTFPSGVTASGGGTVRVWRANSTSAIMILTPNGARKQHIRALSTTWGTWAFILSSADTAEDSVWAAGTSTASYTATPKGIRAAVVGGSVGGGQTWQRPSRSLGTVYTNNTGRAIMVNVSADGSAGQGGELYVRASASSPWVLVASTRDTSTLSAVIPPGHQYRALAGDGLIDWSELR